MKLEENANTNSPVLFTIPLCLSETGPVNLFAFETPEDGRELDSIAGSLSFLIRDSR